MQFQRQQMETVRQSHQRRSTVPRDDPLCTEGCAQFDGAGLYSFKVRAVDRAGNKDPHPPTRSVKVPPPNKYVETQPVEASCWRVTLFCHRDAASYDVYDFLDCLDCFDYIAEFSLPSAELYDSHSEADDPLDLADSPSGADFSLDVDDTYTYPDFYLGFDEIHLNASGQGEPRGKGPKQTVNPILPTIVFMVFFVIAFTEVYVCLKWECACIRIRSRSSAARREEGGTVN